MLQQTLGAISETFCKTGSIVDINEAGMWNENKNIKAWAMNCICTEDVDNKIEI